MKTIVANWKCNKDTGEVLSWINEVGPKSKQVEQKLKIIVAPAFIHLSILKKQIVDNGYKIQLCAQDVSAFNDGAYTGEVSARQICSYAEYVLIGHSERRKNFFEDNNIVNKKINQALNNNIIPIACFSDKVTETGLLQSEDNPFSEDNFRKQIKDSLLGLEEDKKQKVIFMYEPQSAISSYKEGKPREVKAEEISEIIAKIKAQYTYSSIFYGGSVNIDNITEYLSLKNMEGVVIGSASLDPYEFVKIILHASKI